MQPDLTSKNEVVCGGVRVFIEMDVNDVCNGMS